MRLLVRDRVLLNSRLLAGLLIVFQLIVALSALSRGILKQPGFVAGAVFSLAAVMVKWPNSLERR